MRRSQVLVWYLLVGLPRAALAQWSARLELGVIAFSGASHDTSGVMPVADFRPYHAATLQIAVERRWARLGAAVDLLHAQPGFALESDKTVFVAKDLLAFWEIALEASMRLTGSGVGTGPTMRAQLGPLVDIWLPTGGASLTRVGAHAGLSLEWPFGTRVTGSVRAALALSGSAFRPGDLPPRFDVRPLWRRGVAGGVRWRF
jgi:hypothetical protein